MSCNQHGLVAGTGNGSLSGLSNNICQILCSRRNEQRDGVSSTSSKVGERNFRTRIVAETLTIEDIRKKLLRLQEEEDEVMLLDEQNRRHMAMNNEISRNGGEKVQRWLHDSYNGSNDDFHSTKSFKIVQTSRNSMVTASSQRLESMVSGMPQNFVIVGDKTHLN
jgi:hypothetical protein